SVAGRGSRRAERHRSRQCGLWPLANADRRISAGGADRSTTSWVAVARDQALQSRGECKSWLRLELLRYGSRSASRTRPREWLSSSYSFSAPVLPNGDSLGTCCSQHSRLGHPEWDATAGHGRAADCARSKGCLGSQLRVGCSAPPVPPPAVSNACRRDATCMFVACAYRSESQRDGCAERRRDGAGCSAAKDGISQ